MVRRSSRDRDRCGCAGGRRRWRWRGEFGCGLVGVEVGAASAKAPAFCGVRRPAAGCRWVRSGRRFSCGYGYRGRPAPRMRDAIPLSEQAFRQMGDISRPVGSGRERKGRIATNRHCPQSTQVDRGIEVLRGRHLDAKVHGRSGAPARQRRISRHQKRRPGSMNPPTPSYVPLPGKDLPQPGRVPARRTTLPTTSTITTSPGSRPPTRHRSPARAPPTRTRSRTSPRPHPPTHAVPTGGAAPTPTSIDARALTPATRHRGRRRRRSPWPFSLGTESAPGRYRRGRGSAQRPAVDAARVCGHPGKRSW
jgi:hypothetical protein